MLSPIQYRLLLLGKKRTVPFFITNSHKSVIAKTKTSPRDPPDKVPTSPSEWVVDTHRWILHWLWLITSGRRFVMDHKCSYWLSYPRDKSSDGGPADSGFFMYASIDQPGVSAMHYHVVRCWGGNIWVPFQICSPVIGRSKKLLQTIIFQFLVDLPRQGSNWRLIGRKILTLF